MTHFKLGGVVALMTMLTALPMSAQEATTDTGADMAGSAEVGGTMRASDWDADTDGMLNPDEFRTGFAEMKDFTAWDTDGDGMLSEEEWYQGNFDHYDTDASGMLEDAEYGGLEMDMMDRSAAGSSGMGTTGDVGASGTASTGMSGESDDAEGEVEMETDVETETATQ
ncbi:hypothetical protein [Limimaricola cinnabarinus]|uniref:hypothetical protein n=1 Tax=Limimaricola cinnabarinus TaxID=1125964 RepID=UPI0024907E3F|nr:hypothetical protein [Limimaricola cinnabarinus]